jgi:para-nitrobenzyl esterase
MPDLDHAPRRRSILQFAALSAGAALMATPRPVRAAVEPLVETSHGKLRGARENGVLSFKGVRYGETTGGANRFRPPVPVTPWAGARDALAFGSSAPQIPGSPHGLSGWYNAIQPTSEDCLFLNVFAPDAADGRGPGGRRPVMVWLHGGAWSNCAGTAPGFDGTRLARDGDVVVVTINHRLNVFGYLAIGGNDPRFADAGAAGMLDMVAALRWVRDNAAAFGGDPRNVTIFGQSGGAAKVTALMAMPAARGLFHKAIVQSCSGGLRLDGLEEADRQTQALATHLGLTEISGPALQTVPMEQLLNAMKGVADPFRPVLDGRNFAQNPFDPAAPAIAANIPLMIGNAATETRLYMAADMANFSLDAAEVERRLARWLQIDAANASQLMDAYRTQEPDQTPSDLLAAITTDYNYRRNTMRVAELQAMQAKAPVYAYVFDWRTPVLGGALRSPHTLEVPFVFGTTDSAVALVGSGPDLLALERETMARWTSFAHHGVPEAPEGLNWTPYDTANRATMMLSLESQITSNPGGQARQALFGLPYFEYSRPVSYVHA